MYCGIMEENEAASNFFPANFSSDKFTLPLIEGVTVDPEEIVIFR
jgi:hypothetical protein